jgi:hypothetical protein
LQEATRIEEQAEKEKVMQSPCSTKHTTNIIASLLTSTAFQALSMPDAVHGYGEMSIDDLRAKWQHEEGIENEVSIEDLRAAWRLLKRLGLLLDENLTRSEARRPPPCALGWHVRHAQAPPPDRDPHRGCAPCWQAKEMLQMAEKKLGRESRERLALLRRARKAVDHAFGSLAH